jgi:carboxypeptidase PM20D1
MLKKFLLSFFAILFALLSVALFKTFMHVAADSELIEVKGVSIDEAKAIQNLAASIRFKTISYQDREKFPQQEFDNFIKWASDTYPEFHQALKLEQFEHSLLFKWEGSNSTLAPILFEGHYDVVPVIPGTDDLWEEMPFAGTISKIGFGVEEHWMIKAESLG